MSHEDQGTGHDPGAAAHERQGRNAVVTIEIKAAKLLAAGTEGITINVTANQPNPPLPTNPDPPEAA